MIANCRTCGKEFYAYPQLIRIGKGKYCSKKCYQIGMKEIKQYYDNSDFFKSWNGDMFYILGFIFADGCIYKRKKGMRSNRLLISQKEKRILEKIRYKISDRPLYRRPLSKHSNKSYQLDIPNDEIVKDLEKLGVIVRKTPVKQFPDVPNEYLADFIRGYFNGDGSIGFYPYKNYFSSLQVSIASGSFKFLKKMQSILSEIDINSNVYKIKNTVRLDMSTYNALKFCFLFILVNQI